MGPFRILILALFAAMPLQAQQDEFSTPFPWGKTYAAFTSNLKSGNPILKNDPGSRVLISKNDLTYEFNFYGKKRVKEVKVETTIESESGKKVTRFNQLISEPASKNEEALLYAVAVTYPLLPLNDDLKAALKKKLGATSIPEMDQFDIEAGVTLIHVTFARHRNQRFLERIVFVSREYAQKKLSAENEFKKEADEKIKLELQKKPADDAIKKTSTQDRDPNMRSWATIRKQSSTEPPLKAWSESQ